MKIFSYLIDRYFSYLTSTDFHINKRKHFRVTYILVFQINIHHFTLLLLPILCFHHHATSSGDGDFNGHLITPMFLGLNQYLKVDSLSSLMARKGTYKCLFRICSFLLNRFTGGHTFFILLHSL